MGGKKGRSGPPGNLNGSKHAWRALWRRQLLRPQDSWVRQPVESYVKALLRDRPEATTAEQGVIEIVGTARACSLLILEELKKSGMTHLTKDGIALTPAAKDLKGFLTIELNALRTVGLERRAKSITTLAEYVSKSKNGKPHGVEQGPFPQPAPTPEGIAP